MQNPEMQTENFSSLTPDAMLNALESNEVRYEDESHIRRPLNGGLNEQK